MREGPENKGLETNNKLEFREISLSGRREGAENKGLETNNKLVFREISLSGRH